jgi:hypothetical protein
MDAGARGGASALASSRLLWFGLVPLAVGCLVLSACSPGPPSAAQRSAVPSQPPSSQSASPSVVVSPTPAASPTMTGSSPTLLDVNSVALPQWGGTGCPASSSALAQTLTGRFSQCLQVAEVAPGDYTVVLEQVMSPPDDISSADPAMPGLRLSASPSSGPPGTTVTITGSLNAALSSRPDNAELCWDGCPSGLSYSSSALSWLSPTTFRTTMVVPQAPWVTANPPRVARLLSGTYPIGIQCLRQVHACGIGEAEATTSFQLDVPASTVPGWCRTSGTCAQMTVSPARALPGDHITVTGLAPLAAIGPDGLPYAYQLQVIPASASSATVQFESLGNGGATAVYSGYGSLTVLPPPTFAGSNSAGWQLQASNGWQPITMNPSTPSTTAWCSGGAVTIDTAGHTTTVPTGKAAQAALTRMGFPPPPGESATDPLTCETLALLGNGTAGAPAVVAGFDVEPADQDPLYADVALLTTDGGKSWTPLPTPRGAKPVSFGGFRYQGNAVAALFSSTANGSQGVDPALAVETTSDAGRSWHAANLACPDSGPCITFGPYQPGNCAKDGGYQLVIASTDGGQQWTPLESLDENQGGCWPAELLTAADGSEILVDTASPLPVQRSTDAGRTWRDIGVPTLPHEQDGYAYSGSIVAMPGGSLLAITDDTTRPWMLLPPGANTWCQVRTPNTVNQNLLFNSGPRALGDELWWLTSASDRATPVAHHVAVSDVSC